MGSSQLDYILTMNMEDPAEATGYDFILCNTSSHVHISVRLKNMSVATTERKSEAISQKKIRHRWDRINFENFEVELETELLKFPGIGNKPVNQRIELITEVLKQATHRGVPSVITRLKGITYR